MKTKPWQKRISWMLRAPFFVFVPFLVFVLSPPFVCAQGVRGLWDDLVRGTLRVGDDIPIKKSDDFVAELSKTRATRDAVDAELKKAGRIIDDSGGLRKSPRSKEVLDLLKIATSKLDPTVIRRLEKLDEASRDAALVLVRGGEDLTKTIPDLATRGRLLREGGPEIVAAVGMFGPDAAKAALRLEEGIRGGSVVVKEGARAITVADFGRLLSKSENGAWSFFKEYVQPHWKIWAATGAFAAYLTNPEYFQDAAGKLTQAGFEHLTGFVGYVAAGAIRGVGKGTGNATRNVWIAFIESFFSGVNGIFALIGTVVFFGCISLLFRRVRHWLFWPFRWINTIPPPE